MAVQVGLWIDHRKTVIVTVSDEGHATKLVESNVERHVRYSGGAHSGKSQGSQPETREDTRERLLLVYGRVAHAPPCWEPLAVAERRRA
jgi:hypothetical protein